MNSLRYRFKILSEDTEIDNQAKQLSGFSFEGTSVKYSDNSKK